MSSPFPSLSFSPSPPPFRNKASIYNTPRQPQQYTSFSYYSPQTPSPLRTSRNANIMPPPPKSSPPAGITWPVTSIATEDADIGNAFNFSHSIPSPFAPTTSTATKPPSTYAQRSRSASPLTSLNTRTSAARDKRKSLFLEQLKTRREDQRFENRGEQMLRMDWVKERREWEERLRKEGEREGWDMETEDMEDEIQEREEEDGGVSPTEEREIAELVAYFEEGGQEYAQDQEEELGRGVEGGRGDEDMADEDDDYDQLFMEVIGESQEQQGMNQTGQGTEVRRVGFATERLHHDSEGFEESMDMS